MMPSWGNFFRVLWISLVLGAAGGAPLPWRRNITCVIERRTINDILAGLIVSLRCLAKPFVDIVAK